jgi:phosphoglycolate phosphatase-like HAD superfamily hydrolase
MSGFVVDLDAALGDTRPLWDDWLASAAPVLGLDPTILPRDRAAAAEALDAAGAGNWRALLERFAEDRAPVYLRPSADAAAALRRLAAAGARLVLVSDAPLELARVAAAQLGALRHADALEAGAGARDRARTLLGDGAATIDSRAELLAAAAPDTKEPG